MARIANIMLMIRNKRVSFINFFSLPKPEILVTFEDGKKRAKISILNRDPSIIYKYTLNGSDPTINSEIFYDDITVDYSVIFKIQGFRGKECSVIAIENVEVSRPMVSIPVITIDLDICIKISCETEGARIYYTFDGSMPDETDNLYVEPFPIKESCMIKARAFKDDLDPSNVAELNLIVNGEIIAYDFDIVGYGNIYIGGY